jgi:hypothetical protein
MRIVPEIITKDIMIFKSFGKFFKKIAVKTASDKTKNVKNLKGN